ncbi:uncharacterized protein LOC120271547 [Dioscorea cayenensis subsp. rotundata]|uniref:Uncharacterized protein LOC120271547 n=1 Tax=Dioscorea cayennensis subsp. rotundata TaxID=55577 RepID=A0AB40C487_DIOCR|nr:uncharacterized protein LOC120271547 [Dioscorea cayenensis subsp. rotundata]
MDDNSKTLREFVAPSAKQNSSVAEPNHCGLNYNSRISVDAASGGALMNKKVDDAYNLIEDMALNHCQWTSERNTTPKPPGRHEVETLNLIAAKMDALSQKFDKLNANAPSAANITCEICGSTEHLATNCQLIAPPSSESSMEQMNYLHNFSQRPVNNPFSNTYNPGCSNVPRQPPGFQQRISNPQPVRKSNLEALLESFVATQAKQNEEFKQQGQVMNEAIRQLTSKVDSLETHNKMLENQIAQQASSSSRPPGMFPRKPEINPSEHCKAITLRSGKQLEDPKSKQAENENIGVNPSEKNDIQQQTTEYNCRDAEKVDDAPRYTPPKPYIPPVPFPQRLAKAKLDKQFGKFLEVLKKLYINVPFTEALQQMPSYEYKTAELTEECSALIQNKLPPKLKDPGSFSIPCEIGAASFEKALCDLGASVSLMPLSVCKKLDMGELKPTIISLQLADRSVKHPIGILEDIPIKVGKFFVPADFVVLEMEEDTQLPIILGRPFLATAGALIDVKNGKLSLTVGEEKVEFDLANSVKHSFVESSCCRVDLLEQAIKEELPKHISKGSLQLCLVHDELEDD